MRNYTFRALLLLLIAPLFHTNCATIVSKTSYPVSITTNPRGAQLSITDKKGKEIFRGMTPATIKLKAGAGYFSRAEYQVKLSSPGYQENIIPITFKLNGWYFGNILLGGLIGMLIIDPASGAMWRIDKESTEIYRTLTATSMNTMSLQIINVKDVPPSLTGHLVRLNN